MKRAISAAFTSAASVPLVALALASPACATSAEVSVPAPVAAGNSVGVHVVNGSAQWIQCTGTLAGADGWHASQAMNPLWLIAPNASYDSTFLNVPTGTYQFGWSCNTPIAPQQFWGTAGVGGESGSPTVTAQVETVVVTGSGGGVPGGGGSAGSSSGSAGSSGGSSASSGGAVDIGRVLGSLS